MSRQSLVRLFFLVLLLPGAAFAQGRVVEIERRIVTLSVGSQHGVKMGMRGVVISTLVARKSTSSDGSLRLRAGKSNHVAARFVVTEVRESTCRARLEVVEPGFRVEVGQETIFTDPITQTQPTRKNAAKNDPLANARERARDRLKNDDWDGALEWLRMLAEADPSDSVFREAMAQKRREANAALERGDFQDAISACDAGLDVIADSSLTSLKERAIAAGFSDQYGAIISEANALLGDLENLDSRPAGQPAPVAEMAELIRRRTTVLRQLVKTASGDDPELRRPIVDLMRELAGRGVVTIGAGDFMMGCTKGDSECQDDEKPAHQRPVNSFALDASEVTVGQYRAFVFATEHHTPPSPSFEQTSLHPVVNVSWEEAQAYCRWVGARLPTEAEWEYAARAGRLDWRYTSGNTIDHERANYQGVGGRDKWNRTGPVTSFAPNRWGLFDMAGNVWEWCSDPYTANYIGDDGKGSPIAGARVLRGGSWLGRDSYMRVSSRIWYMPSRHMFNIGFRCARDQAGTETTDEPQ